MEAAEEEEEEEEEEEDDDAEDEDLVESGPSSLALSSSSPLCDACCIVVVEADRIGRDDCNEREGEEGVVETFNCLYDIPLEPIPDDDPVPGVGGGTGEAPDADVVETGVGTCKRATRSCAESLV